MTSSGEAERPLMFDAACEVQFKDRHETIPAAALNQFVSLFLPDRNLHPRISKLLVVDLYIWTTFNGIAPGSVTREIQALEGRGSSTRGTKPATKFTGSYLKGLWHKHFFCAHFMVENIQNGWGKGRIENLVQETLRQVHEEDGDGPTSPKLADKLSAELARRAISETLDLRRDTGALTGEWIVFAKHDGQNYYLCLNTHDAGDENIRARIIGHCVPEYPFLATLLQSDSSASSTEESA